MPTRADDVRRLVGRNPPGRSSHREASVGSDVNGVGFGTRDRDLERSTGKETARIVMISASRRDEAERGFGFERATSERRRAGKSHSRHE